MRPFEQKQDQAQKAVSASLAQPDKAAPEPTRRQHPVLHLQRAIGNQAVQRMLQSDVEGREAGLAGSASPRIEHEISRLPAHSRAAKPLQTKLQISEPGDEYEREADRIADQVMAAASPHTVGSVLPQIQRFSGQPAGQAGETPVSVDQALASPGRPLEPALRQDMEQRFGHDFSRVRVHTGAAAEQSARDVNANAYTVTSNVVFGAGRFAPMAREGRRLLAHELVHVMQQDRGQRMLQREESRSRRPTAVPPVQIVVRVSRSADPGDVLRQIHKQFGSIGFTDDFVKPGASLGALLDEFHRRVGNALRDFTSRSKKSSLALYFTLPPNHDLAEVRRNFFVLSYARVQNELQIEDVHRIEAQRIETEGRDREEEENATAARLARAREQDDLKRKIDHEVQDVIKEVMWWTHGTLYGIYTHGQFVTSRLWVSEHRDYSLAKIVYDSAEYRVRIGRALWNAYYSPNSVEVVYQIPFVPAPTHDSTNSPKSSTPGETNNVIDDCDKLVYKDPRGFEECLKQLGRQPSDQMVQIGKAVGETGATFLESLDPVDPVNAVTTVAGGVFLSKAPILFAGINRLRKAGKLALAVRRPIKVVQLARVTTKASKIDPELLEMAWRYRYSTMGSTEQALFRNFMSAKVVVNGESKYLRALNVPRSAYHSENHLQVLAQELRRELGPNIKFEVKQIFSERIPCEDCLRFLDREFSSAEIFYAVNEGDRAEELFNYYWDASKL